MTIKDARNALQCAKALRQIGEHVVAGRMALAAQKAAHQSKARGAYDLACSAHLIAAGPYPAVTGDALAELGRIRAESNHLFRR